MPSRIGISPPATPQPQGRGRGEFGSGRLCVLPRRYYRAGGRRIAGASGHSHSDETGNDKYMPLLTARRWGIMGEAQAQLRLSDINFMTWVFSVKLMRD